MSKFNRPDESYYPECIGVFWDVVDYPFPNGVSPALIYHQMKLFVESLACPAEVTSIMAYVDKEKFSDEMIRDYEDAGITIIPRQADEYARYRAMIIDIEWWQVDMFAHPLIGRAVMVISKEIKKESHFFTYFEWIFSVCHPVFFTPDPDDHDPPPRQDGWLEPICFNLPSGPIDKTVTLHRTSHRNRKSLETMPHCLINPGSPDEFASSPSREFASSPSREFASSSSREFASAFPSSMSCTHAIVFWDCMDYPLLYGDLHYTVSVLSSSLEDIGYRCYFPFRVYIDNESDNKFVTDYEDDVVTIILTRQGKYARVHSMLVDIVLWTMENPATYFEPKTLIVFSKNIKQGTDFFNVLEALDKRYYNILLRHPDFDFNNQAFPHEIRFKYLSNDGLPKLWRSRQEAVGFSNGLASLNYQDLSKSATVIFWNVNGCPTKFSSINTVLHKKGYHGPVIIRPYVEMDSVDDVDDLVDKTSERFECESRIRVRSKGNPYAKVTRILLDILFWAMNKYGDLPQNLMLISKPFEDTTKCDIVFQALERRGFHVIFKPSDKVPLIDDYTIESFESLFETVPDGKELFIPESQSRILTDQSIQLADARVYLSWVVGNCPPSNPRKIWSIFKSVLEKKGYDRMESQLMVYIDEGISDEMIKVYKKAGVCLILIPKEDKCGKVNGMLLDLICKTRIVKGTANFMVISEPFSDPMCDSVVESLKLRGFNVLFEELDYMLTYGSSLWSAKSLLDGSCSAPSGSSS